MFLRFFPIQRRCKYLLHEERLKLYYFFAIEWIVLNLFVSFFLNIFTLRSVLLVFTLHVVKAKRSRDENKNEQMNRFVNNFMANLSDEEKKLSFLTNQARALRAYSEGSMQRVSK